MSRSEFLGVAKLVSRLLAPEPETGACEGPLDQALVRRQKLAPLAYRLGHGEFKADFVHSALVAEMQSAMYDRVLAALEERGIEVCRIKGAAYLSDIYQDPAERPMGDLDILVRPARVEDSIAALEPLGLQPRGGKDFMFAETHHAVTLDGGGFSIDVHRHITQAYRSAIDLEAVWKRADLRAHRLQRLDELAFHLAHMLRHELFVPLTSYVDLARLLDRIGNDREAVLQRCDDFRIGRGARAALRLLDALREASLETRAGRYPMPSAAEILSGQALSRRRQLVVKGMLVDGARELLGLGYVTLRERGLRLGSYKL